MMEFKLNPKLEEWVRGHNKICHSNASAGEHYQFEFIPTGIMEIQTVKCLCCEEERTEYDGW